MLVTVTINKAGIYLVQFLDENFEEMPNLSEALVESSPADGGLHKIQFTVLSGDYTIPYIKIVSQTGNYKSSFIKDYRVNCAAPPVPVPVPITPPVPIYSPPPVTPVSCNCTLITMTPTGLGPDAKWTVNYIDCDGLPQSTSGNGLDAPRLRYVCRTGAITSFGQVSITYTVLVPPSPTPSPSPTPAPTPTPIPTPTPTPTPVYIGESNRVESTGFRLSFSNGLYSDTNPTPPSGYANYYFINDYPLIGNAGNPLPFTNIDLSSLSGRMIMLRKLVLKTSVFPNYNAFLSSGDSANLPDQTNNIKSNSQIILIP